MRRFFGALMVVLAYPLALINLITSPFRKGRRTDMSDEETVQQSKRPLTRDEMVTSNTRWLGILMICACAAAICLALSCFVDAGLGMLAGGVFVIRWITGGGGA